MKLPDLTARRNLFRAAAGFWLCIAVSPALPAADSAATEQRHDAIWMISTRHLRTPSWETSAEADLRVLQYDPAGQDWSDATLQDFLAEDVDGVPTVFYLHGNRTEWNEAFQRGWRFYHALTAGMESEARLRYVIWSWPSDELKGPIRDVRAKAWRTNMDGHYLGWLLSRMSPDARVSLVGYSYGARVITGAMHLLNGGSLVGKKLPLAEPASRAPMRVTLLAAALHNDWLLPGRPHEGAWSYTDRMSVIYNSCDPVLKRYRFVDPCGCPQALGYVGFWDADRLGATAERILERDVCRYVGKTHEINAYYCSSQVMRWVREATLWTGED